MTKSSTDSLFIFKGGVIVKGIEIDGIRLCRKVNLSFDHYAYFLPKEKEVGDIFVDQTIGLVHLGSKGFVVSCQDGGDVPGYSGFKTVYLSHEEFNKKTIPVLTYFSHNFNEVWNIVTKLGKATRSVWHGNQYVWWRNGTFYCTQKFINDDGDSWLETAFYSPSDEDKNATDWAIVHFGKARGVDDTRRLH